MYEYGLVQECGYFGDISILMGQPSEYSYFNNPQTDTALLALDAKQFTEICDCHPIAKEILTTRARQRREMFENYKTVILLKYMRAITKNPLIALQNEQKTSDKVIKAQNVKVQLFGCFIKQYELTRAMRKLQREENGPQESHFFHGMSRGLTRMDDSNDSNE